MVNSVFPKKRITVDLTLTFIHLAFFLIILLINLLYFRYVHFVLLALFLVPPGFLSFFWTYQRRYPVNKTKRFVIRTIYIILSILLLLFSSGTMLLDEIFVPVKDPIYYQHLLRMYDYPQKEQMVHFPKAVPADAKDVRFYELPAVLQGGDTFSLKYRTTPDEINRIIAEYEGKALAVIDMDEYNSDQYVLDQNICFPDFFVDVTGYDSDRLPDDYRLYILNSGSDDTSWHNHGLSCGIAVSTQRCEVIYWYMAW